MVKRDYSGWSKEELIKEVARLRELSRFGLVWEDRTEDVVERCQNALPVLNEVEELAIEGSSLIPTSFVIEGDNYHSLSVLNYTHSNSVDVIYIDPPYNTGNQDFIYDDNYVDREDSFRHSKWLSFISKRLWLAKSLLKENGVIFISIGEDEFAQLKMLCDSIFGEENYITNFIWEKSQHFGRQKVNFYNNADYILAYAKRLKGDKLKQLLVERVQDEFEDAPLYNGSNPTNTLHFPKGTVKFNIADGIYSESTDEKYELISPVTVKNGLNANELVLRFKSRWSPKKVLEEVQGGTTYWVKSDKFAVRAIYGAGKTAKASPKQIIFTNRNNDLKATSRFGQKVGVNEEATSELREIVGEQDVFTYPKPVSLIKYLLSLYFDDQIDAYPKNLKVLDFFAGSGTTGEAVIQMNAEDGGNRSFILCTNNENEIARKVTYRRLQKAIEKFKKGREKDTESLRYFITDFVAREKTDDQTRVRLVERSLKLISVREDAFSVVQKTDSMVLLDNTSHFCLVMYQAAEIAQAIDLLNSQTSPKKAHIYIFSLSNDDYSAEFAGLRMPFEIRPIPEGVLEVYRRIFRNVAITEEVDAK